jgi:hypothetical protein
MEFITVIIFILVVWMGVISYYLVKVIRHYRNLTQGVDRFKLPEILDIILGNQDKNRKDIEDLKFGLERVREDAFSHVQKVGILRFNPFSDTGSNQSFVLAILDGLNTGIVLTSLHSRGITRWYAKNVHEGKGIDHKLSEEEEKAIKSAVKLKHVS